MSDDPVEKRTTELGSQADDVHRIAVVAKDLHAIVVAAARESFGKEKLSDPDCLMIAKHAEAIFWRRVRGGWTSARDACFATPRASD